MFKRLSIIACLAGLPGVAGASDDFVWLSSSGAFTAPARDAFYVQDQGSDMIPFAWLKALKHPDGTGFLSDQLGRYGYLPNPGRADGLPLPVGFTTLNASGPKTVGMTCAACHTRQITAGGKSYRIDGGPALVDFQRLLTDLDAAVGAVLADPAAFSAFAADVKTSDPAADLTTLKAQVQTWFDAFDAIVAASITKTPQPVAWGYGRLDAISMILNRVTGLDIGAGDARVIGANMHPADAPARYPFLWNVATEKKTQWPGFAPNDPPAGPLGRNVGEVMGVFARFDPQKFYFALQPYKSNSLDFEGLEKLERAVDSLPSPVWPWPVDPEKVERGRTSFQAVCAGCHSLSPGGRLFQRDTPVKDVCTDAAEDNLLGRRVVSAGVLKGAATYSLRPATLADDALEIDVLKSAVLGSILQHFAYPFPIFGGEAVDPAHAGAGEVVAFGQNTMREMARHDPLAPSVGAASALSARAMHAAPAGYASLPNILSAPADPDPTVCAKRGAQDAPAAYEARFLGGVWAVAPYLHDGSVGTLKDLLKPAAERRASFKIGPQYDIDEVGLAQDQPEGASSTMTTTDCGDLASGRSRCGHEYGVDLTEPQKADLLEFLKTL